MSQHFNLTLAELQPRGDHAINGVDLRSYLLKHVMHEQIGHPFRFMCFQYHYFHDAMRSRNRVKRHAAEVIIQERYEQLLKKMELQSKNENFYFTTTLLLAGFIILSLFVYMISRI